MDELFKAVESGEYVNVPYIAHESELARMERINKRQWILCIILFLGLVLSNAGWIYYESQWEDVVTTVEQESETGYNNYIGNDGDINN